MHRIAETLHRILHFLLGRFIKPNQGELRPVPNHILWLTAFLCFNVLLQGIGDVVLKFLSYSTVLPELPWRTDFLFLTAVSVLMGYQTITGMHHRKFDVTRNSIELGLLVETGLIVGDSEFIFSNAATIPDVIFMRLPFILLTLINVGILLYSYHYLQLHRWKFTR